VDIIQVILASSSLLDPNWNLDNKA